MIPYAQENAVAQRRSNEAISVEIRLFQRQTLANAIEVGRRLTELKENFDDVNDFHEFVKREFDISKSSTYGFMRLFNEYGAAQQSLFGAEVASPLLGKLNYSQALALLAVPADEREAFVELNHVEDVSVRELQKLIADRDAEIKRLSGESERVTQTLTDEITAKDNIIDGHILKLGNAQERIRELEARPIETVAVENTEELAAAEERIRALEASVADIQEGNSALTADKSRLQAELETARREADELRTRPPAALSPIIEKFKWQFADWNAKLNELLTFSAAQEASDDDRSKMSRAIAKALRQAIDYMEK